ncbi:MAG: hypothetical protein A3A98_01045 [Candidatus Staskawiczbacteria bacterium RIFCSPLOWO2_01_FULL_40_39]|uniref:Thioredoxin domain-containing protein n=1 Tax=Candidatus Staskawiczbacteria bacterium RIFCSPHIGHO2_01_FULL_39_25 TaxID=1802202 RepID=A0A1G2HN89_9BACT|nr:MAG: hypothetical protein A2730_01045 [Candidatus Staskawiczbacteria bacterium RIFCSPHIGHO2_01_FULL_39_25]OGZ73317.1 MAG: hypothetical protein A3A98_01045 [Candidatus Staskawiczbacteria bacterium RIFCSPLOWO2_01_FULL_40_39]OGZ75073.1 MAG: hypothetical protein A3I87_01250 [Candidatus Staskawiczbacteria bacterium RIFCSPLOWO2_02_FULL_39_8]
MSKKTISFIALAVVATGILIFMWVSYYNTPGKLDAFAQCLKDKGVKFYGTFWCPHCQNQKALFGSSKKYLPYVECSTADSRGQLQVCKNENIEAYPTWKFPDGTSEQGEVALEKLAEKSGCQLPQ